MACPFYIFQRNVKMIMEGLPIQVIIPIPYCQNMGPMLQYEQAKFT